MIKKVKLITGEIFKDKRGNLKFINQFNLGEIKRFYQVENSNTKIIRAFHGHFKEAKFVWVVSGSILLCTVFLDHKKNPSKSGKVERFILKADNPQIVYIPPSFANGFRALETDTKVIFFSTSTLEESKKDDFRFPANYWGEEVWQSD